LPEATAVKEEEEKERKREGRERRGGWRVSLPDRTVTVFPSCHAIFIGRNDGRSRVGRKRGRKGGGKRTRDTRVRTFFLVAVHSINSGFGTRQKRGGGREKKGREGPGEHKGPKFPVKCVSNFSQCSIALSL